MFTRKPVGKSLTKCFLVKKHFLNVDFWLCMCLQHFHDNFLLLTKEGTSAHSRQGRPKHTWIPTALPAEVSALANLIRTWGPKSTNFPTSAWGHATGRFRCLPHLPGMKVNSSIPGARAARFSQRLYCRTASNGRSSAGPLWMPVTPSLKEGNPDFYSLHSSLLGTHWRFSSGTIHMTIFTQFYS